MATPEQRARMTRYVTDRLKDARRYALHISAGTGLFDVIFIHDKDTGSKQRDYALILHSLDASDASEARREVFDFADRELTNGIMPAHIFFKDGKNFHVRAADKHKAHNVIYGMESLNNYASDERNAFIDIGKPGNGLEKLALSSYIDGKQALHKELNLAYYQPQTTKNPEGIRTFNLKPVIFDYSYLRPEDREKRHLSLTVQSKDLYLPVETSGNKQGPIILGRSYDHASVMHRDRQLPLVPVKELSKKAI